MLRRFLMAVAVGVLAVASFAASQVALRTEALASTPGCTAGAFAGYCGTQTDAESPAMSWDVFQQRAVAGNKIIAYPDSDNDRAVDFVAIQPGTGPDSNAKFFVYSPNGQISNLCISEPSQGAGLVLRPCNGSSFQVFTAKPVGDTGLDEWVNKATGDVVLANGIRSQLTGEAPPSAPSSGVEWGFTG